MLRQMGATRWSEGAQGLAKDHERRYELDSSSQPTSDGPPAMGDEGAHAAPGNRPCAGVGPWVLLQPDTRSMGPGRSFLCHSCMPTMSRTAEQGGTGP